MQIVKASIIDVFEDNPDVLVMAHGCNCFCTMNSGVAKVIRENYPEAYKADIATVRGDFNKLGDYTSAVVRTETGYKNIVNCYTQYRYGRDGKVYLEYDALESCLKKIEKDSTGKVVLPRIGCGLAGGSWQKVEDLILDILGDRAIICVQ